MKTLYQKVRDNPTPQVVAKKIYIGIKNRCGSPGVYKNIKNRMSLAELTQYIEQHWDDYMILYSKWQEEGFVKKYCPSVDRIDSKKDYDISNIQIIPHYLNAQKANLGRRKTLQHRQLLGKSRSRRAKKLTPKQVAAIRKEYNRCNATQTGLAKKYNVSQQNIYLIVRNKIWEHINYQP